MKLEELLTDFDGADPEESLEMLIDLSGSLPPVSAERAATPRSPDCRIQECQTPVDLWTDVVSGKVVLEAIVPEQSPTVRGFVALLVTGLTGAKPEEALTVPDDLLPRLGLAETLGMTRQRGFHGIVARIKQDVSRALAREGSPGASAPIR